jgi:hypothetical protein
MVATTAPLEMAACLKTSAVADRSSDIAAAIKCGIQPNALRGCARAASAWMANPCPKTDDTAHHRTTQSAISLQIPQIGPASVAPKLLQSP